MTGPLAKARAAWGEDMPDWVAMLARACQESSQNQVAGRLGRSASLVSAVLARKYQGDMAAVEDLVRGVYMAAAVDCPRLGRILTSDCQDWRLKARSFSATNSLRVDMYRACHRCPRFARPKEAADAS